MGETANYPASPFLRFVEVPITGRVTKVWDVKATEGGSYLGEVKWFARWRRYTFYPELGGVFDASCLRAIADFCHTQTFERKRERKLERAAEFTDHGIKGRPYGT